MAARDPHSRPTGLIVLGTALITVVVVLVIIFAYIYSGSYDVAVDSSDPGLIHWVVNTTRERSIESRAEKLTVPEGFGSPEQVRQGVELYDHRCAGCHSAPGRDERDEQRFYPPPPNFVEHSHTPEPEEVHWIVAHGIKMTAMPRFGSDFSDDELWALAAFLQKVHGMTLDEYVALGGRARPQFMPPPPDTTKAGPNRGPQGGG